MSETVEEPYTILVVDDSRAMRELLIAAISRLGDANVAEAGNGAEALEMFVGGWRPDLIITDINMPVMSGLSLLEKLRSEAKLKDIPVVIITTETAIEERQLALTLGANAFVTKPIKITAVVNTLRPLLPVRP